MKTYLTSSSVYLVVTALLLATSCYKSNIFSTGGDAKPTVTSQTNKEVVNSDADANTSSTTIDTETPVNPALVTGVFLTCHSVDAEASKDQFGCAMVDQGNRKLPLNKILANTSWTTPLITAGNAVAVSSQPIADAGSKYHVNVMLAGSTSATRASTTQNIVVELSGTTLNTHQTVSFSYLLARAVQKPTPPLSAVVGPVGGSTTTSTAGSSTANNIANAVSSFLNSFASTTPAATTTTTTPTGTSNVPTINSGSSTSLPSNGGSGSTTTATTPPAASCSYDGQTYAVNSQLCTVEDSSDILNCNASSDGVSAPTFGLFLSCLYGCSTATNACKDQSSQVTCQNNNVTYNVGATICYNSGEVDVCTNAGGTGLFQTQTTCQSGYTCVAAGSAPMASASCQPGP